MNATQSSLYPNATTSTTTDTTTSQEHFDCARRIVETIENRIGYSNGLIKTSINSDSLSTADNSFLAVAKYFLGEVDEARRIIQTIEEQIGYTEGLINSNVCSRQESEFVSKREVSRYEEPDSSSNIYFALALSILGESQKAKEIFSNVEDKATLDAVKMIYYQLFTSYQYMFGSELYLFPEVYLVLAGYLTGDATKAKTFGKKNEDYLRRRKELGFDNEPGTLSELTKKSAEEMESTAHPFGKALITVVKYMKSDKIGAERLLQKIIEDYNENYKDDSEDRLIRPYSINCLVVRDEELYIYRTIDNLAVAIAHLALSGAMDEYIGRVTRFIEQERQKQLEDKNELILSKEEKKILELAKLEMSVRDLCEYPFTKAREVCEDVYFQQ